MSESAEKLDQVVNSNVHVIDHPLVQHKLTLMREKDCQSNMFRLLLKEIAFLLCYELLRDLPTSTMEIETPLETMQAPVLAGEDVCIVSILRAGNGFLDGLLELVPTARVGFIGLYRDHETMLPVEYYLKFPPDIAKRETIVVDPMLATGGSAAAAIDKVKEKGATNIKFLCLIAAPEGIKTLTEAHPDIDIYVAAVDRELNENSYILPGIGDAGDRIYGTK
jgi:uracil phosphoribosyltransferase